jgi:hypothetical protein
MTSARDDVFFSPDALAPPPPVPPAGAVPALPTFLPPTELEPAPQPAPEPAAPPEQESPVASATDTPPAPDQPAQDQPAGFTAGQLVRYRHRDVVTGGWLEGAGVVLQAAQADEAVVVSPLSPYVLSVEPAHLTALELD